MTELKNWSDQLNIVAEWEGGTNLQRSWKLRRKMRAAQNRHLVVECRASAARPSLRGICSWSRREVVDYSRERAVFVVQTLLSSCLVGEDQRDPGHGTSCCVLPGIIRTGSRDNGSSIIGGVNDQYRNQYIFPYLQYYSTGNGTFWDIFKKSFCRKMSVLFPISHLLVLLVHNKSKLDQK